MFLTRREVQDVRKAGFDVLVVEGADPGMSDDDVLTVSVDHSLVEPIALFRSDALGRELSLGEFLASWFVLDDELTT